MSDAMATAWREAEDELPVDWQLELQVGAFGRRDLYTASATYCYSLRHYRLNVGPARSVPFEMTHARRAVVALRALTAKLRERRP